MNEKPTSSLLGIWLKGLILEIALFVVALALPIGMMLWFLLRSHA